jgi:hypothetical protein
MITTMHRVLLVAVLAQLIAIAAGAQVIVWNKYDPMAVRADRTADVALEAQTSGTLSGMRLDYANGGYDDPTDLKQAARVFVSQ